MDPQQCLKIHFSMVIYQAKKQESYKMVIWEGLLLLNPYLMCISQRK